MVPMNDDPGVAPEPELLGLDAPLKKSIEVIKEHTVLTEIDRIAVGLVASGEMTEPEARALGAGEYVVARSRWAVAN
jgi:hypothetical protein